MPAPAVGPCTRITMQTYRPQLVRHGARPGVMGFLISVSDGIPRSRYTSTATPSIGRGTSRAGSEGQRTSCRTPKTSPV
jgi:hypothetical protein